VLVAPMDCKLGPEFLPELLNNARSGASLLYLCRRLREPAALPGFQGVRISLNC